MVLRKTYDTRVKYLVMKGLLPDLYRKQIHKSLISKWQRESPEKYTGYELNDNIEELYELMNAGIEPNQKEKTELIVGGGTDNNNKAVTTLLQKYPVDKLVCSVQCRWTDW